MTTSAPERNLRQPGLPGAVVAGVILVVVLGLVGEALIFSNYLQITRTVRPGFSRATRRLPLLSSLRTSVLELHAATVPLLTADIPDFRRVNALRPEVEQHLNDLRQEAAGNAAYTPALDAVGALLEIWDLQIAALQAGPDVAREAVLIFEIQRSFTFAETALDELYAAEEQGFYTSTGQAFTALGNIQGVLLGLGGLIAVTGALLFVLLRRTVRTQIERAYDRLRVAAEVGRAASSILDVEQLLKQVVNLIRDRFDFYHVSVFLLDERGERAVLRESTGEAGARLKAAGHALGVGSQSIIGWVTENRRTRLAGEVGADPVHFKNELLPETRSELAIPLLVGNRLLGALDVQARSPDAFSDVDVQALQGLADQVAIAIANAAQYGTQQVRSQKLAALSEAAVQLAEPQRSLADLLDLAARRAMAVVNADGAAIWLPVENDELELKVWYRGQVAQPVGRRLSRTEGQVAQVLGGAGPLQAEGGADGLPSRGGAVATGLAVPMNWQAGVTGLLVLSRFRPGAAFSDEDRDVARLFASDVAAAVENFRLIAETQARVTELFALNQISTTLSREAPTDLGRALNAAAGQMLSLFDVDHARIVLLDPVAGDAETVAEHPDWGRIGTRLPLEDNLLVRQMLTDQTPVSVESAAHDGRLNEPARADLLGLSVESVVLVPLLARESALGFVALETVGRRRQLDATELNLGRTAAAQVATAVQNARLFDQNSRQARRERLINQITDRIRRAVDVPGVLAATASELGAALGAGRAKIEISLAASPPHRPGGNGHGSPSAQGSGANGQEASP